MDILTDFAETLKDLLLLTGATHLDIQHATGIPNGNVSMWLNKKYSPTVSSLDGVFKY